MTCTLRPASRKDAATLAELVNMAGEGLPATLWARQADNDVDAFGVGKRQILLDDGTFSWRKFTIAEVDGAVAGMIMSHVTPADPVPFDENTPPVYRPLVQLENQAPATRLIDAVATYASYRHKGIARSLIAEAEKHPGRQGMAFVMPNGNEDARRFYCHMGYREAAKAPLVRTDWDTPSTEWVLMRKS